MDTEQSPGGEIGVEEAANRFAALMDAEANPETKQTEAAAEAEEADATEYETDETELDEEAPDALEVAAENDEEVEYEADDDGEVDEAELNEDQLVTVKINGKTEQIPLKEALQGYQRQSDYSRNMNQLRDQRVALEQEQGSVSQERAQYAVLLQALQEQLQSMAPQEPDWARLHEEDPINFPLVEKQWRDHKERLAATQLERERVAMLQQQEQQQNMARVVDQGREYLANQVPEWRDQKKWQEARGKLVEYGQKVGYSPEELSQAYDPRAILVLDKARKYDELMANRPKPQRARGPKPMRSGSSSSSPRQQTNVTRAKQRLAQTGSVDDAARLFGLLDQ